jgi:hypothetical protein
MNAGQLNRLFMILVVGTLSSCAAVNRYVYRASPIDLPGLTQKGESRLSAGGGENIELNRASGLAGADFQGAYAISNRVTVLSGYSYRSGNDGGSNINEPNFSFSPIYENDSARLQYRNSTWEVGAAYTIPLARRTFLSIGAGGGGGNFHIGDQGALYDTAYDCYQDSRVTQWFLQPAMYWKLKIVEIGVGLRLSGTYYGQVNTNYTEEQAVKFDVNGLQGKMMVMGQPFWIFRIYPGLSWLQIELQGSINAGGASSETSYHYYGINAGISVAVYPSRLLAKRRKRD